MKVQSSQDGFITGLRFYKQPGNGGRHVGHLWSANGEQLAEVEFTDETASGWQSERLPVPVAITQDTVYVASYHSRSARFSASGQYFTSDVGQGPLSAPGSGNGVFRYGASAFPDQTFGSTNYWVDATFEQTRPADDRPPRVSAVTPVAGAEGVDLTSVISATFDEPVNPDTITPSTFSVRDAENDLVAGAVTYDGATRTATLTPTTELASGEQYTATIKGAAGGVADLAGNPLAASYSWQLKTLVACPCTLFGDDAAPNGFADEGQPVELGMKFSSSEEGFITAVRFYKPEGDSGHHVGHVWSSTGEQLAEVEFTAESESGWQTAQLPAPVAVERDAQYVVSYHSSEGRFAYTAGYFSGDIGTGPLHAPGLGNGVYRYGQSAFPDQTFGATNYWVDATFERDAGHDTRPPSVVSLSPARDEHSSDLPTEISATFDEPLDDRLVGEDNVMLEDHDGSRVAGTVAYEGSARRVMFTPSAPLRYGQQYAMTIRGGGNGVIDLAGNALEQDVSWRFFTPAQCPCTLFESADAPSDAAAVHDDQPIEVGVKFRSAEDGVITALRFYKQANNTGTHVGHLWSEDGHLLARAPFEDETPSGWQQADLQDPVAVDKSTLYVASYHSSSGYFAMDQSGLTDSQDRPPLSAPASGLVGGNGVYRYGDGDFPDRTFAASNYWVDATFERPPPPTAPEQTAAPEITGMATDGQTLTAGNGTWTGTQPITYAYQWRRCDLVGENCADISDATETSYRLTTDDVGRKLRVVVTATNSVASITGVSAPTAVVNALAPSLVTAPTVRGAAREGQLLTAERGEWSGTTPTYTYRWQACTPTCTPISGATDEALRLTAAHVGATIRVVVTARNSAGSGSSASAETPTVTSGPPVSLTAPTITGSAQVDEELSANAGTWAGTAPIEHAYHWLRCHSNGADCTPITGAASATYVPAAADVGARVKVSVTATNPVGLSTATSAASDPIDPEASVSDRAIEGAVGALFRGSIYTAPCTVRCREIFERELAGLDKDTERELTDLRGDLGLLGYDLAEAPATGDRATAAAEGDGLSPLEELEDRIFRIHLHTDRDYANILARVGSQRFLWRWRVPRRVDHIPSDFGEGTWPWMCPCSGEGPPVNLGDIVFYPGHAAPGSAYIPAPHTGWYGAWEAEGSGEWFNSTHYWMTPNRVPSGPDWCDVNWIGYRPLGAIPGFYNALTVWGFPTSRPPHYCENRDGMLATDVPTPTAPLQPWIDGEPADGSLNLLPAEEPPTPDDVRDQLCTELRSGSYQRADEALGFPCDRQLADKFRPILRFDTSEPWRPLNVERFLNETFSDDQETARHRLCSSISFPGGCEDWRTGLAAPSQMLDDQVVDPSVEDRFWPYIDVHGEGDDIDNFVSPRLSECEHGSLNDCDAGPDTAMYFHSSGPYPEADYRFLDYWQFYRYNKFDGGDHEADWENVVVALPHESDPQDFAWVGMSAHGSHFRYLRSAMHCDDDLSDGSCGSEGAPSGNDRVDVFVANGSHATYPHRCDADLFGAATCPRPDLPGTPGVGEKGHDGERAWGANDDPGSLLEMPAWARWRGWWGFKDNNSHVRSPGQQPAYGEPFGADCQELWSNGLESCSAPSARVSGVADSDATDPCAAWNGPGVAATVCDPAELKRAMAEGTLGVNTGPLVTATGSAPGRVRSSGGVAQIMGPTMRSGEQLSLDASLSPRAELLVRVQDGATVRRARFAAADLPNGRKTLRLTSTTRGKVQLMRPDGTLVRPIGVERAP